jgi:pimeloyl-ACP methyl ester carboxylesterase
VPDIAVDGLTFHVQRAGQGDATVVMIHGLVIDNLSSLYYALAPGVVDSMDVVLYDLRGHGRSDRPPTGYGLDDSVDDLWAVVDALGVEGPVYLLGNSYGGTIALEAARRDPERVAGLVLVEAHVAVAGWGDHIAEQLELAGFGLQEEDLEAWLDAKAGRKLGKLVRHVDGLVNHTSIIGDMAAGRAMSSDDLRGITCPVYAVYGEYSDVIDRAHELEALLPRLELDILVDCSHSAMNEATVTMRGLISDWFARAQKGEDVPGRTRKVLPGGPNEGSGAEHRSAVEKYLANLERRRAAAETTDAAAHDLAGGG